MAASLKGNTPLTATGDPPAKAPTSDRSAIEDLQSKIADLERLVLLTNDTACGLGGLMGRTIVEAGLVSREDLADAIEKRAGITDSDDYNPILHALARSIRMNFPGGSFEVIEGGRSEKN